MKRQKRSIGSFLNLLIIVSIVIFYASSTFAQGEGHRYKDCYDRCGAYGICRDFIPPRESEEIIMSYFSSKRLRVGRLYHRGRFVEADIYENGRLRDRIIFDRKTGRIRSAY